MSDRDYITVGDVAKRFNCAVWQVRRLFTRGLVPPAKRIGAYRAISTADLSLIERALRKAGYLNSTRLRETGAGIPRKDRGKK